MFISYSHADAKWLARLRVHLKPLERHGLIVAWDDTTIKPGTEWREAIRNALERARVAVLLVSADFLASDFIATNELPPLLAAAEAHGTLMLPLILDHCRFTKTEGLSRFQAVNNPAKPLATLDRSRREAEFNKLSGIIEEALISTFEEQTTLSGEAPRPKEGGAKSQSRELAKRHELRLRFWEQLLALARKKGLPFHANRSPNTSNWIGGKAGVAGYRWNYVIWMNDAGAVELDIDTGDKRKNKRLFDALRSRKTEIEAAFGAPLEWQRIDDARRSGVRYSVREGGLTAPENEWPRIQAAMVEAMARLAKVLQPHLQRCASASPQDNAVHVVAAEVHFERYTVRKLASGTIEVERDGRQVKPAKPVLRELASKLNLQFDNLNTRQLGSLIIGRIKELQRQEAAKALAGTSQDLDRFLAEKVRDHFERKQRMR